MDLIKNLGRARVTMKGKVEQFLIRTLCATHGNGQSPVIVVSEIKDTGSYYNCSIVGCWHSSGKYSLYIQDENKFNNI